MNPVLPGLPTPSQPYRVPEEIKVSLESLGHPDRTVREDIQETPDQQGSVAFRATQVPQGCLERWELLAQGEIRVLVDSRGSKEYPEKMEDQGKLVARENSEKLGLKDPPGRPVHPDDLGHRVYQAKAAQLEPRERWDDRETGEIEEK